MQRRSSRQGRAGIVGAMVAALLAPTACGSSSGGASESTGNAAPQPITLAVVGPMSGDEALDGAHLRQGAELAASQVNAAGGVAAGPYRGSRLAIRTFDDHGSAADSVSIARQLVSNDIYWAVIGGGPADVAIAAAPVLDRASVPYLTTGAPTPKLVETPRHGVFVVPPPAQAYAFSAAERARVLGFKTPVIFQANAAFATGMADLFEQHYTGGSGGLKRETYNLGDHGTQGLVADAQGANPDVVVLAGLAADDASLLAQMRSAGMATPVLDLEGALYDPGFLQAAGPLAEGALGQTPTDPDRSTAAARHLRDTFDAASATTLVPAAAAYGYEAVRAVAVALAAGPADRAHLADALHRVDIADTGAGRVRFDAGGNRQGGLLWYFHVKDGHFVMDTGYEATTPAAVKEIALQH